MEEICVSKSTGLALQLELNLPFLLCFTLNLRAIFQVQAPEGLIINWKVDLTEGFLRYRLGGLILFWTGLYNEGLIFGILQYLERLFKALRKGLAL